MIELQYPFDSARIIQKRRSLRRQLLADGRPRIEKKIAEPFMVITATDGCFGYLTSPMAFEGLLLETLEESNTPLEWEGKLREAIGAVTGDDYTLQASAVGFCDFAMLKQYYMNAWANFQHLYGSRLRSAGDEEALRSIWNEYKLEYMGE